MSYEEKQIWCYAVLTPLLYGNYVALILGRAKGMPLAEVPYAGALLWTMGAMVVGCVLSAIVLAIASPGECGKRDVRDREIHRFGEYVGQGVMATACLAVLFLALFKVPHFWIANAMFLGCVLAALVAAITKLVAYRRGFHAC